MSGSKKFALDANVFIEAKNRYYRFSLCPGYWQALLVHHNANRVFSIDKVRDELVRTHKEPGEGPREDDLGNWAKNDVPETFFCKTQDKVVADAFRHMITWVNSESQFKPAAKAEFASAADGWLIAYAKVNGLIVVTHEAPAPDAQNRVPMPNVCIEFDVDCVNTFEMLEELKVEFILKTRR
jgi:hypothetical protein